MRIPITDKIKLSELRAARAAMTPGTWSYFDRDGRIEAPGVNEFLPKTICEMFIANHDANAAAIIATHNAADVLIEIAWTALELSAAGAAFEKAEAMRLGPRSIEHRDLERAAIRAERVHLEALAKVEL